MTKLNYIKTKIKNLLPTKETLEGLGMHIIIIAVLFIPIVGATLSQIQLNEIREIRQQEELIYQELKGKYMEAQLAKEEK